MKQHLIPRCYLKSWIEPFTPPGRTSAIWRIPIVNLEPGEAFRRSPEKSFTIADRFTVTLEDGTKNYTVEKTLGQLEGDFTLLLDHIRRGEKLAPMQRAKLAVFTAAMMGRSEKDAEHWASQIRNVAERIEQIEKASGVEPTDSQGAREYANDNFAPRHVLDTIEVAAPVLFTMNPMILKTDDEIGFITSDSPCVVYNPALRRVPPFYRGPGLLQKDIEITLPLTPQRLLLYRHDTPMQGYVTVGRASVDEANRSQVWFAGKEIVSWTNRTRPEWFEKRNPPPDAWENTPERVRLW